LITHTATAGGAPSCPAIVGSAMLAIAPSSTAMVIASQIAAAAK